MTTANSSSPPVRLGAIGVDSSHLPEFGRRLKALADGGTSACRMTAMWTDGQHDMPAEQVAKWIDTATQLGVEKKDSLDDLLENVDGVLVLAVNGNRHFELAKRAIELGLPTYIDKPLTCDLKQAKELLALTRKSGAACYSASSLRFAAEVWAARDDESLGEKVAIDAFGPGELNASMKGLFFYGVHTIEMVDAIWGPGVKRVSAISTPDRDLVDLDYADGRYARLRLERSASYSFGATIHGKKKVGHFTVDFGDVYNQLIKGMVKFFQGGMPPAPLRDIVENVAVMEAGNTSIDRGGEWVEVETIE